MIEKGEDFDVIYTDVSKAFDSFAHERLLQKLVKLGIAGDLLNWARSFLSGRSQWVNLEDMTSDWKDVISGIPQGSVIGPLLFVIFINDMPDEVKFNMCKLFADDCKLYGSANIDNDNKMQIDPNEVEKWSKKWQLPFNATKYKVMPFGYHTKKGNYHLYETSHNEKDLGVVIDDNLKFHTHSAAASKKANQILGIIKKSYASRDPTTIGTLIKTMVRQHLEYGNAIWGPFYKMDKRKEEPVERRATKLIPELKDKTYEERLKIPSLVYGRKREDMIWMYNIINGLVRLETTKLFLP